MKRISLHLVAALMLPTMAWGQEITFDVPEASEAFQAAIRDASLVAALSPEDEPAPQDYVAAARADYRRLLTALYTRGYYAGTISILVNGLEAANIAPLDAPTTISTISYTVNLGPVFTFGTTAVAPLPEGTALPESFASGEFARSDVITQAVSTGVDAWRNAGYAKAAAGAQKITAQHDTSVLDVSVAIDTGPQLTFGALTISGDSTVREGRIEKIAGIPIGAIYNPQDLLNAERRLRETGAFDSASAVMADNIGPNNTLPIDLHLVDAKPRRIGFGIELSTIDGLKVSSYWMHRNFLGGAERFRVEGEVAGVGGETGGTDYAIRASLDRPAVYGADTNLFSRAELSRSDEPNYLIDKASFEFGLKRPIGEDIDGFAGIGILAAREVTDLGTKSYTLVTLPLGATMDRRDNKTDAKNGYYIDLAATPFVNIDNGALGSRVFADARAYKTLGESAKFTLAARSQIGTVLGSAAKDTPADFLFYSGGGNTVRGQSYDSLGVTTTQSSVTSTTGGLSFVGAQVEARYAVTGKIGLVGFYDFGQIGADAGFAGKNDWHAGTGVGVRYNTGIGPIRLDVGTPASGDKVGQSVQVYIGIGQSF